MIPWWVVLGWTFVVFMAGALVGIVLNAKALQGANSVIDRLMRQATLEQVLGNERETKS